MEKQKTIWKYELEVNDHQQIEMPEGAEILCVQVQFGKPHIWVMVNPDNQKVKIYIQTIGTGHLFEDFQQKYIGSYQMRQGELVFHVFEKRMRIKEIKP